MGSPAWSDREVSLLERFADVEDWLEQVRQRITGRTEAAICTKMSKVRGELGFSDGREKDNQTAFNRRAVRSSARLLSAIEQAGVRP